MCFLKVAFVAVVMTAPALVGAAEVKSNERLIELEIGSGADAVEAAVKKAANSAAERCANSKQSAFIERLQAGPSAWSVDDAVALHYRCVAADDPSLASPGREASRADAGQTLVTRAKPLLDRSPFGWDLSYQRAFDAASVSRADTVRKYFRDGWYGAEYLGQRTSPLDPALFRDLETTGVEAAYVIDYQAFFYFGHRVISLSYATRGKGEGRAWNSRQKRIETSVVAPDKVRRIAEELMQFRAAVPPKGPVPYKPDGASDSSFVYSGYVGVASVMLDGKTRQFLITQEDLVEQIAGTDPRDGRLLRMLQSAALPAAERAKEIESDRRREAATPLLEAAATGDLARIAQLLDAGADINTEIDNTTPLIAAVKAKQLAAVHLLLARKADPNFRAQNRDGALQWAAYYKQLDAMRALVEAGADVNLKGDPWGSPLAAVVHSYDLAAIRYLVEHGARADERGVILDALGYWSNREIVEYLLAHGAEVNATAALMKMATGVSVIEGAKGLEVMRILIAAGADVNFASLDCWTALRSAQHMRNTAAEQLLRQHGADETLVERCRQDRARRKEEAAAGGLVEDRTAGFIRVDKTNFDRTVLQSTQPVLVYVWSARCEWCAEMDPTVASLAAKHGQKILIAKLDVAADVTTPDKYGVKFVPTLILFKNGKVVDTLEGVRGEADVAKWLERNLR